MPRCALNEDTDDPTDWKGSDDDNWLMRWRIKYKHWFAFANRCPRGLTWTTVFFPGLFLLPFTIWFTGFSWWYLFPVIIIPVQRKWRLLPKTLLALRGPGVWRFENTNSTSITPGEDLTLLKEGYYLSRIQRWCRWHIQISWPLFVAGHFYWKAEDVPTPVDEHDTDGEIVNVYRGWHRDEDEIFWGDGGFAGTCWK